MFMNNSCDGPPLGGLYSNMANQKCWDTPTAMGLRLVCVLVTLARVGGGYIKMN